MASGGISLEYLSYIGAENNPGGGCRAIFNFQGSDGGSLYDDYTFTIGMQYEPKVIVTASNVEVTGLTGKTTNVAHETASYASGTLEIYPLQYGTTYVISTFDSSGTPFSNVTFTPQQNNSVKAKNLVSGTLAESITTSTTNILVHVGDNLGAQGIIDFFPNTPFYITIMPKSPEIGVANHLDSEIIKITNVDHDQVGNAALTGVRAQRGTTAKAFSTGDIVTVGSYCDDAVFLSEDGTTETETPWIGTDDITDNAVTDDKIDWSTTTLGETHHLTLNTTLPFTAYNGTNYVLSVQNEQFSGGTYLLTFPSVIMYVSSLNYQAHINYRIDGGADQQIRSWAHWANQQQGTQTATIPINIPAGAHTVEIGFGTNNNDKQLQVYGYQTLDAWLVKIGG